MNKDKTKPGGPFHEDIPFDSIPGPEDGGFSFEPEERATPATPATKGAPILGAGLKPEAKQAEIVERPARANPPLKTTPPETGRANLAALPETSSATALRSSAGDRAVTKNGRLERVHAAVKLSLARKELYSIDGGDSFALSADGFRALNRVAGLHLAMTPTVAVDGLEQSNPYIVKGPSGVISDVFVRGALVGRVASGNLIAVVQTLHYSPIQYFLRDLVQAVKRGKSWSEEDRRMVVDRDWKDTGRLVGLKAFTRPLEDHEALYKLDDEIGVLIDLRSPRINEVIATAAENRIFAVRKATTILERRLMQAHPGLPSATLDPALVSVVREEQEGYGGRRKNVIADAVATLPVLGWAPEPEVLGLADSFRTGRPVDPRFFVEMDPASAGLLDDEAPKLPDAAAQVGGER